MPTLITTLRWHIGKLSLNQLDSIAYLFFSSLSGNEPCVLGPATGVVDEIDEAEVDMIELILTQVD